MNFNKKYKIHKAVNSVSHAKRYATNLVHLDVPGKRLLATDGHIMASVPVEIDDSDFTTNVPPQVFADACKCNSDRAVVHMNENNQIAITGYGVDGRLSTDLPQPDYDSRLHPTIDCPKARIRINAKKLYQLAQAIGSNKVTLLVDVEPDDSGVFCETLNPIHVTPLDVSHPKAVGAIMPLSIV